MKKVYLVMAAATLITGNAIGQGIGIEGGINLSQLADQYEGETTANQIKVGMHAGVVGDIDVSTHFAVQPGLRWTMKGGLEERNHNVTEGGITFARQEKNKLTYHYMEMPINLVYKSGMPGANRFLIGAGPYIAYMIYGKNSFQWKDFKLEGGTTVEYKTQGSDNLEIGNDEGSELKHLDYGGQAFIGYQLANGFVVKGGAQMGFANTQNTSHLSGSFMQKNYNFFFTLGYMFNCKKTAAATKPSM